MAQRSIRFPDELAARIGAEAERLDRSFTWVVVRTLEKALGESMDLPEGPREGSGGLPVNSGGRPSSAPPRASKAAIALETRDAVRARNDALARQAKLNAARDKKR